jgi:hypothetical protein
MRDAQVSGAVVRVVEIPLAEDRPAAADTRRPSHLRRQGPPYRLMLAAVPVHNLAAIHASRLITAQPSSASSGHRFR